MDVQWILVSSLLLLGIQPSLQCGGGDPPDNSALIAEQQRAREQELKLWCHEHCVSEWTPWSNCDTSCGKGNMKRTREQTNSEWCKLLPSFTCVQSTDQSGACDAGCPYGGLSNSRSCGGCPSGRTGQCCETELFCEYPKRPANGRVTGTWPPRPGTRADFTCDQGYNLQGEDYSICQEDETWNHATPKCNLIQCTVPSAGQHAVLLNPKPEGYAFGESVVYDCEDGYKMIGEPKRTCTRGLTGNGMWTGFDIQCKPVKCPPPVIPQNGRITSQVTSFQYLDRVTFKCDSGYKLVGSDVIQCLASGTWFGHQPTCEVITCEPPFSPRHGSVKVRKSGILSFAFFECDEGYRLEPNVPKLLCTEEGSWNGTEPQCAAASCGDPGTPAHGFRSGGVFTYGNKVTFNCERGYQMKGGAKEIECQSNALWSGSPPTCEACPPNFYMDGEKCVACPEHSLTATDASTDKLQCLCDQENGFIGKPGGPCEEVFCVELAAPDNGAMPQCGNRVGDSCLFSCNPGFVVERGSTLRTCQNTGDWDGTAPFCVPCKLNTYKSGERTCSPCPAHSHTVEPGQVLTGCVCDEGYTGPAGGPCQDVNECISNSGKGPCSDTCENNDGSFKCRCSIPGYKIDPRNDLECIAEKQCRNLTRDEAPENGGLVCHWYYEENSQHCTSKCNPGYELPARTNDYETCGPATGYTWSYQVADPTATLAPCIEEYFPDFRLEGESAYFAAACEDLTEEQKNDAKTEFANRLNEKGVCAKRETKICDIKDMGIICGRTTVRRRRRGVDYTLQSVDFAFNVSALKFEEKALDCKGKICPWLKIPDKHCDGYCVSGYKRYLKAAVEFAKRQLVSIHAPGVVQGLKFQAGNMEFEPAANGFRSSEVIKECPIGMMPTEEQCLPCRAGSYLNEDLNECVVCPMNTYTDKDRQTECMPCKIKYGVGFATYSNGSTTCTICEEGTWGEECVKSCDCAHGKCSPFNGECICPSGWEGDKCQHDVNSCVEGACYPGVTCTDQPPPGTGFTCGPCPAGLHGDGITCSTLVQKRSLPSWELRSEF